MQRRAFCLTTLNTCLLGYTMQAGALTDTPQPWYLSLVTDHDSAARLGRAWLTHNSQEADAEYLEASLRQALQAAPGSPRQALQQCCRSDFRQQQTVMLDGWLLSRTEVRLYALIALHS